MRNQMKIIMVILMAIGFTYAKPIEYKAGYSDGCQSARGHYTRSAYKYKHSRSYRKAWRKGKRNCRYKKSTRKHKKTHQTFRKKRAKAYTQSKCRGTEFAWDAFKRGWNDGSRAFKRGKPLKQRGCAPYRHGWIRGYRSCQCSDSYESDTYVQGYNDGCTTVVSYNKRNYTRYRQSNEYKTGWDQGYRDCKKMY